MFSTRYLVILAAAACLGGLPGLAHGQLNLLCSASADWCKALADEFEKDTGVKVTFVSKGGRAAFAMLAYEKGKPQADVWFGGPAQGHLRALKFGLVDEYASPMVAQLQPWAQKVAEESKSTSFGVYARVLGIGYNSALATQKKLAPPACWKDLVKPGYAGEVHVANPNAAGSTYLAMAAMAQLFGEDEAFKYLKAMYKAPPPQPAKKGSGGADATAALPKGVPGVGSGKGSGKGGGKGGGKSGPQGSTQNTGQGGGKGGDRVGAADASIAKAPPPVGSAIAGIGYVGDVIAEAESGSPVKVVAPCEGTIYEIGALSIVKGARNLDNAKKFVDWALGAKAQALVAKTQYVYPANTAVAPSPFAPKFGEIKFIDYDRAKFETSQARGHLVNRWSQEFGTTSP